MLFDQRLQAQNQMKVTDEDEAEEDEDSEDDYFDSSRIHYAKKIANGPDLQLKI